MKRLANIDILKFLGLLLIILAHVNPPSVIFQLRNFDVILMILISSYLYILNSEKVKNKKNYLLKRFKRLVLPTWIFLIIYFIINFIFGIEFVSKKTVISTFILNNGIGYVWIIRIYMIVALLLPLVMQLLNKYSKRRIYIFSLILYVIYEILCCSGIFDNLILNYFFAYLIPCYILILCTDYIMNSDSKKVMYFSLFNMMIFLVLMVVFYFQTGSIQNTNYMKYPFRLYYISYALFASGILIVFFRNEKITDIIHNKLIGFISNHSLWIYLWHILFIKIAFIENWFLNYCFVLSLSIIITFIQSKIINIIEKKFSKNFFLELFKG